MAGCQYPNSDNIHFYGIDNGNELTKNSCVNILIRITFISTKSPQRKDSKELCVNILIRITFISTREIPLRLFKTSIVSIS